MIEVSSDNRLCPKVESLSESSGTRRKRDAVSLFTAWLRPLASFQGRQRREAVEESPVFLSQATLMAVLDSDETEQALRNVIVIRWGH